MEEGNSSAVKRVNNLLSALNGHPGSTHIVGGYHSHPEPKGTKAKTAPSKSDLDSIRTEFLPEYANLESWLELITKIRCPFAERAQKKGSTDFRRLKKLATTARYDSWHAYNFLTGAFLISPKEKNGYDELRIEVLGQQ